LEKLVVSLKEVGLVGIEAIYSTYNSAEERQIRKLAAKHDLCISGGSDFHGGTKPGLEIGTGYGKLFVPYEVLEKLREK
jgi:predicted metal-dependent phosphoesterase TrpH